MIRTVALNCVVDIPPVVQEWKEALGRGDFSRIPNLYSEGATLDDLDHSSPVVGVPSIREHFACLVIARAGLHAEFSSMNGRWDDEKREFIRISGNYSMRWSNAEREEQLAMAKYIFSLKEGRIDQHISIAQDDAEKRARYDHMICKL